MDALPPDLGRSFVVVGVFDGLHLGHQYLLEQLVREAATRSSRATVITFDHHPDEILTGTAPPLLIDPDERLERLAAAGVDVTVVQHFDDTLRRTPYDDFVERIRDRVELTGFLMTPDAAFGFERRGTPDALRALGRSDGFEVVVVDPFVLDGRAVSSTEIRAAISTGDLDRAATLLGRPFTLSGALHDGELRPAMPMAVPPDGRYAVQVDGVPAKMTVRHGRVAIDAPARSGRVHVEVMS